MTRVASAAAGAGAASASSTRVGSVSVLVGPDASVAWAAAASASIARVSAASAASAVVAPTTSAPAADCAASSAADSTCCAPSAASKPWGASGEEGSGVALLEDVGFMGAPHAVQNLEAAGFLLPQRVQNIGSPFVQVIWQHNTGARGGRVKRLLANVTCERAALAAALPLRNI